MFFKSRNKIGKLFLLHGFIDVLNFSDFKVGWGRGLEILPRNILNVFNLYFVVNLFFKRGILFTEIDLKIMYKGFSVHLNSLMTVFLIRIN